MFKKKPILTQEEVLAIFDQEEGHRQAARILRDEAAELKGDYWNPNYLQKVEIDWRLHQADVHKRYADKLEKKALKENSRRIKSVRKS